jgi:hypothetical protein
MRVTGLARGLSAGLEPWRAPRAVHDPGKVIADLAAALALGAGLTITGDIQDAIGKIPAGAWPRPMTPTASHGTAPGAGPARRWEPKRLRVRIFAAAGRLVRGGRRLRLRLAERWPRAREITAAISRLQALPSG